MFPELRRRTGPKNVEADKGWARLKRELEEAEVVVARVDMLEKAMYEVIQREGCNDLWHFLTGRGDV